MKITITRSIALALVLLFTHAAFAQIEERNVRAGMTFLAGDAMQGRGSGTPFERIAAEYVGSQFMQFGLEPAGDAGFDGKPGYVQTVETVGRPRLKDLRFGTMGNPFTFGKDWIAVSISSDAISGRVRSLELSEPAKQGEIAVVKLTDEDTLQSIQPEVQRMAREGAAAVVVIASASILSSWEELSKLRPFMSRRGTLVVVRDQAAQAFAGMANMYARDPNNDPIEIHAKFSEPDKGRTWNAIGKLTGSDLKLSAEVIVLSSHLDHLGVRENAPGDDKLFNGADDDASGTVAVMELARVLAAGKRPKRTVYFVCYGSEEAGGYGSRHFVDNLPFPKENLIANLQWEMIGRPDAKVKPDELWLTGYERSNLGPELAKRGAKLVQDPHPQQNFFQRSDNYTLARQGVIAHTVSSFGLHTDYHGASDELKTIDFGYMTPAINSMVKPIEWLANSDFRPEWVDGKRP